MAVKTKSPVAVKAPSKVHIDETKCKGCELCVYYCPQETLVMAKYVSDRGFVPAIVVQDNCTGCQECARVCPDVCITIWRQ